MFVECGLLAQSSAWADPNGAMSQCHFARTTHPCLTLPVLIYDSHSNGYNNVATDEKVLFFPFQKQTTGMFHWVSVKYIKGYPSTNQTIRCSSAKYEEYRMKSARKTTFAMMSMFASNGYMLTIVVMVETILMLLLVQWWWCWWWWWWVGILVLLTRARCHLTFSPYLRPDHTPW